MALGCQVPQGCQGYRAPWDQRESLASVASLVCQAQQATGSQVCLASKGTVGSPGHKEPSAIRGNLVLMGSQESQALLASSGHQAHQGPWDCQASMGCPEAKGMWGRVGLQGCQGYVGTRDQAASRESQGCQGKGACLGRWDLRAQQAPKENQGSLGSQGCQD